MTTGQRGDSACLRTNFAHGAETFWVSTRRSAYLLATALRCPLGVRWADSPVCLVVDPESWRGLGTAKCFEHEALGEINPAAYQAFVRLVYFRSARFAGFERRRKSRCASDVRWAMES